MLLAFGGLSHAQTGISITPPRVYFVVGPGQSQTEKVIVSNPSTDYPLELGVSFEDWEYGDQGENLTYEPGTLPTSCAAWVTLPEGYFSLAPGESKEIEVQMTMPANHVTSDVPVHTAVMYVTQLNPRGSLDQEGANIRIAVRTGIKLYQRLPGQYDLSIDISNFQYQKTEEGAFLVLSFDNTGSIWADGHINLELLDQDTGNKIPLPDVSFYSMPGDQRQQAINLPADLPPARYIATAILNYGESGTVKIAELDFNHAN